MGTTVNISLRELYNLHDLVDSFQKDTIEDCTNLKESLGRLKSISSGKELVKIEATVSKIEEILSNAQIDLKQLSQKITGYEMLVIRLKKVAGSTTTNSDSSSSSLYSESTPQSSSEFQNGFGSSISSEASGMGGTGSAHYSEKNAIFLMEKSTLDQAKLNQEMCDFDGVYRTPDYVKISSNGRRITDLDAVGDFLSPVNGEKIYCTRIAWRCNGVGESTSQNVCGAEFCYKDGSFCGSYVGKDWREIFDNNYYDTKRYRN